MPTTLYILVITTINSFQCFALIQLLTSGGPNHSTDTIMYYIYYTAFKLYRYGYGNAMGVMQVRNMDMTAMNTVLIIQRMAAGAVGPTEK